MGKQSVIAHAKTIGVFSALIGAFSLIFIFPKAAVTILALAVVTGFVGLASVLLFTLYKDVYNAFKKPEPKKYVPNAAPASSRKTRAEETTSKLLEPIGD